MGKIEVTSLDPRLHAFRPDLADTRLRGKVSSGRFVDGSPARIGAPVADLVDAPKTGAGLSTQMLVGARVSVLDRTGGFAWVQAAADGYVGYVAEGDLASVDGTPTHRVVAPRTFVYPGPDLRFARSGMMSMGSEIEIVDHAETRGTRYALLSTGKAVIEDHLCAIDAVANDYVSVAETLIGTPYLWGGASGFGIDCSGLVQLSMRMAGRAVLRDTDMQAATVGQPMEPGADHAALRRGDLVFWKGHVAIVTGPDTIIHASGHTMLVSREGLQDAIARIGYLYGGSTGFRRP